MKPELRALGVAAALFTLAGCSSMRPLPIKEPPAKNAAGKVTEPDYTRGGLLPATDLDAARKNLKIYGDWYQQQADAFRGDEYFASDTTFIGGVLAALGGLTKSPETSIAGGLIAGGGSVASQRYKYVVQAENYEKASDAMYCMYRNLYGAGDGVVPVASVNEAIDEVRRKLRKYQATVTLATPDLTQLEASLRKNIDAKNRNQIVIANKAAGNVVALATIQDAERDLLRSEMDKCVAAF